MGFPVYLETETPDLFQDNLLSKPAYPDKKKLIVDETNNMLDKLTQEYGVSPIYSCLQSSAYCLAQVAANYQSRGEKIPKELENFISKTYPKLMADNVDLMEEQYALLNTDGTA